MPQKVIRKIDLHESQLVKKAVGFPIDGGEILLNVDSGAEFNIARHFPTALVGSNDGYPVPNKLSNLFDNTNSTKARFVDASVGKRMVGSPGILGQASINVQSTPRRGFLVFDFGRKINPRKFELILNGISLAPNNQTRFISSFDLANNFDPDRGVKLYFQNAIDNLGSTNSGENGVSGTNVQETLYQNNDDFITEIIPAGTAPHTIVTSGGVEEVMGDNETYGVNKLIFESIFTGGAYDGFQFLIVEFRGVKAEFTFDVHGINLFEEVDPRIYNIEFDDALLDLAGWKNLRYDGSKLTGQKINEFNKGDISYGKNPVIERKTTALYIVDACIGAEQENEDLAFIEGHSYLRIKQILIINEDDDSIQVIDRESEDFNVFQRFITNDFPTGAKFKLRIIDESIQNSLKPDYFAKFNKGLLFSSFEYIPATSTEVRQRTAIVKNKNEYSTSNNQPQKDSDGNETFLNINVEEEEPIGVFNSPDVDFNRNLLSTVPTFGTGDIGSPFKFNNAVFDSLSLHKILERSNAANINIDGNVVDNTASRFNLLFRYGTFIGGTASNENAKGGGSAYAATGFIPGSESEAYFEHNFYPDYSKSFVRKNKFTERYIPGAAKKRAGSQTAFYQLFANEETTDITFNPNRADAGTLGANVFIGAVPEIISASIDFAAKNNIEMHLTINNGNIDCAPGLNDERSISTFEVETTNFQNSSSITNFVQSETSFGTERYDSATQPPFWGTVTDFQIVLKPNFLPTIPTFRDKFKAGIVGTHGSNSTITLDDLRTKTAIELRDVYLRGNQGFFVDDFGTLSKIPRIYGTNISQENDFGNPVQDPTLVRHEGNFNYTLSFLDKGPIIIANVNKDDELFDGIGEKGLLLLPDHLEIGIRDNIDFYLRKAGIIEKRTIKAPTRPERGR